MENDQNQIETIDGCEAVDEAVGNAAVVEPDGQVSITEADIERNLGEFGVDRANIVAKNAVTAGGLANAIRSPEQVARNTMTFDVEVMQGDRTDQEQSGRCWMFAALNTLRIRVMRKYSLKNFEFSQAYITYFDKLEKSNWFLENIIATADEPLDGRLVQFLLVDPVTDGGQWDMFRSLVKKYGAVPKEAMPETACTENTGRLDEFLTRYLRKCARDLREAHASGRSDDELRAEKKQMMGNVQKMLTICLGEPPASFEVRLRDKDDNMALSGTFTPRGFFAEAVDMDVDSYISVISAPTADKPFGRTYTVSCLGNVAEDGTVRYLNLPPEDLKRAAIAQLKDDLPVWFGCDVCQDFLSGDDGIMDIDACDVDTLFGFEVTGGFDKASRLEYGESAMTHAMVLEGVNLDDAGEPTLWKVENSWGKDHGREGFDTLADSWFDEYVYQVVVDEKYLTEEQRRAYHEMEPVVLDPWDPMGAPAR